MRSIHDDEGRSWTAYAVERSVAHMRTGAVLAFREEGPEGEPILTDVTFNSIEAARFALGAMADKELGRRLQWARAEAGRL